MKRIKWTQEEDNLIISNYPISGPDMQLPGRTRVAIKNRAQYLGVYFRDEYAHWSKAELDILRTYYPVLGGKIIDRLPGRSLRNIQITAFRLGIKKNKTVK